MSDDGSSLRLDTVTNGEQVIIIVRGDVDAHSAPQLAAVVETLAEDVRVVELDLSELGFFDSTGVGVIASVLRRLTTVDGQLRLSNVPDMVDHLLELTNLTPYVTIVSRRSD